MIIKSKDQEMSKVNEKHISFLAEKDAKVTQVEKLLQE
jgi:hypothetical protein